MVDEFRKKFVFTWQIEHFSLCPFENGEFMSSPKFIAENIGGREWYLQLYPKGFHEGVKRFLSCYLLPVKQNKEPIDYKLEAIGYDGNVLIEKEVKNKVSLNDIGFPDFLCIDELNESMKMWEKDFLTIRCCIMGECVKIKQLASEKTAVSKFRVDRCSFNWIIEIPDTSGWKKSKEILFYEKSQLKLTLTDLSDDIEIGIQRMDQECSKSQSISCKISLIDLKGNEVESKIANYLFSTKNTGGIWKFPTFLSKKDFLTNHDGLIWNSTFTLKFKVSASTGEYFSEIKSIKYEGLLHDKTLALVDSDSTLLEALGNMFKSGKNSDVKFRIENRMIPAHKNILSARSPVFSAMFDHDMLENKTSFVDIEDLDYKTLNLLLEFIYTGYVNELDTETALKLLMAGNKYQIPSLMKKCDAFLVSHLSVENVCDVYATADLIDSSNSKSKAFEFIEENSSNVLRSTSWSDWMDKNVKLANEILFKLALNSSH